MISDDPQSQNWVRPAFVARIQAEIVHPGNWRKNGGWPNWHPSRYEALNEIKWHVLKLAVALLSGDRNAVSEHCADIAGACMKCSDVYGTD